MHDLHAWSGDDHAELRRIIKIRLHKQRCGVQLQSIEAGKLLGYESQLKRGIPAEYDGKSHDEDDRANRDVDHKQQHPAPSDIRVNRQPRRQCLAFTNHDQATPSSRRRATSSLSFSIQSCDATAG